MSRVWKNDEITLHVSLYLMWFNLCLNNCQLIRTNKYSLNIEKFNFLCYLLRGVESHQMSTRKLEAVT